MSKPGGEYAWPSSRGDGTDGMTLREYACIQLSVPETGEPWLDELIRQSQTDWFAGQALIALCSPSLLLVGQDGKQSPYEWKERVKDAYEIAADAMQEAKKPSGPKQ